MGWGSFVASVVIALIVGEISKVFKEARGGNLFAALIGAQLGMLLVKDSGWFAKGIVAILFAIVMVWLLSLGGKKEETKLESHENPPAPPAQNP